MRLTYTLLFLLGASLCAFSQQAAQPEQLTNQRIIELSRNGVRPDELARLITTAPEVSFNLTPADIDILMKAGISDDLIKVMAARELKAPANPAVSQFPSETQAPTIISTGSGREWSPRVSVFGGYSYLNVDTNGLTSRQSLNGWETSPAININKWFAAEGDISGYYKNNVLGIDGVNSRDYAFLGGPRVNVGRVFFHSLLGVDHLVGSAFGLSASQNSFAGAFGGGFQSKAFGGHWAIRCSADYVLTRHNIFGGDPFTQNNVRVGGGIVYIFSRSEVR